MLQLLMLQVALNLLVPAFLLALQKLLFAPGPLFGVDRTALWRQNQRGARGLRLNGDSGSCSRRRRSGCDRWRRLTSKQSLALVAQHVLRCQGCGRHGCWR